MDTASSRQARASTLMRQYTDDVLLLMMSYQEEDPDEARQAFQEFIIRHQGYIEKICHRYCIPFIEGEEAEKDLRNDTLLLIYQSADSFESGSAQTSEEISLEVKKFIFQAVRLAFQRRFAYVKESKLAKRQSPEDQSDPEEADDSETSSFFSSLDEAILKKALSKLDDRTKDILHAYCLDGNVLVGSRQHISDELMQGLCERYRTTPENIRQIKGRAIAKLRVAFGMTQK
jgi:RNA polymerase sigma factor (sigma-70 family)